MNDEKHVYVASSWRNGMQEHIVRELREWGFPVFDFKNNNAVFHWNDIDLLWRFWTFDDCMSALKSPPAEKGFETDFGALENASALVLVMPCGRSAHLELGWAVGRGIPTAIWHDKFEVCDPELMTKMVGLQTTEIDAIGYFLDEHAVPRRREHQ